MKAINILTAVLILFSFTACESDSSSAPDSNISDISAENEIIKQTIDDLPLGDLDDEEIAGLILMREEEKLARDVYLYLYDKHGMKIFTNISKSEATHMYTLKVILDKYGIEDPIKSDVPGVFTDAHLADLYTQLTTLGSESLLNAMIVGVTIEDLDIKDLMDLTEQTEQQDILLAYDNLTRGSRNHLRSFYSQLLRNNGSYSAQFISQDLFDDIVNSPKETGGSW